MTSQGVNEICAIYQDLSVPDVVEDQEEVSESARMTADILNLLQRLPSDSSFLEKLPHSGEITLENARKFIVNVVVETEGISESEATARANEKLERQGRTAMVQKRAVVPENERVAVSAL